MSSGGRSPPQPDTGYSSLKAEVASPTKPDMHYEHANPYQLPNPYTLGPVTSASPQHDPATQHRIIDGLFSFFFHSQLLFDSSLKSSRALIMIIDILF